MATLTNNVQQYGTNITAAPVTLNGSVFAVGTTTIFVLTSSGSFISWQNGRSAFLNTLSEIPAFTAFQIRPGGAITTDDNQFSFSTTIQTGESLVSPNEYSVFLITGQSNATGFGADSPITARQPYNNLTFIGGSFFNGTTSGTIPLVEGNKQITNISLNDNTHGETIASACANFLSTLTKRNFFVLNAGRDGNSYDGIRKGGSTFTYESSMTGISNAKTQLEAANKTLKMGFAVLRHGEADDSVNTANYDALILQQQQNIETDSKAITGQTGTIPLFICQMNNWTKNNKTTSIVCNAQLTAIENNPGKIYGVQEKYSLGYQSDGVHLSAVSQRDSGYYYAWAVYKNLYLKEVWYPLIPLKVIYNSVAGTIVIVYNVPDRGILVNDTSRVSDPGRFGFRVYDAANTLITITDVELAENAIRLTIGTATTPSHVRYALDGTAGVNAGATTGARGTIRGSVAIPNTENRTLYHWSWAFQKPVNWTSPLITSGTLSDRSVVGSFQGILNVATGFRINGTVQTLTNVVGVSNLWGGDATANGNTFYIAVSNINLYTINVQTNTASTFAAGVGIDVADCLLNAAETHLYLLGQTKIRRMTLADKTVIDVAATGITSAGRGCFNAAETRIFFIDSGTIKVCNIADGVITTLGTLSNARNIALSQDEQILYILHDSSGVYSMPTSGGTPVVYQANIGGWGMTREPGTGHLIVARLGANDIVRVTTPTPSIQSIATGVATPIVVRAKGTGSSSFIMSANFSNTATYKIV